MSQSLFKISTELQTIITDLIENGGEINESIQSALAISEEQLKEYNKLKLASEAKAAKDDKTNVAQSDLAELIARVKELEASNALRPKDDRTFNSSGQLVGAYIKYPLDAKNYPSPVERLMDEPKLIQFAFKTNYIIKYKVSYSFYKTVDNVQIKEPRFELQLERIKFDDAGEATNKRYIVRKLIMHEDVDTAIIVAEREGIKIDESNELAFLNEMRYLQIRDWLLDIFFPPINTKPEGIQEEVVGGQLVQFYESNSDTAKSIDFEKFTEKKI